MLGLKIAFKHNILEQFGRVQSNTVGSYFLLQIFLYLPISHCLLTMQTHEFGQDIFGQFEIMSTLLVNFPSPPPQPLLNLPFGICVVDYLSCAKLLCTS